MTTRTRKDHEGRIWHYGDSEGLWRHGKHIIGDGEKNGSRFQIWGGPQSSRTEHKTLKDAMWACY
jgi:hypothetical protein